ncbi:hypothetical protein [Nocardia bovistercoris]|uniref:Uncharacterized protein n=1 Tax=Nocardia bovistercoris TaxID=2785916 RepID=A0A931N2H2_9NOCA|nr:hypothetical protein [Nocardia bovistercoris]MBH0775508.1 hypothetical protein [Nocardia bovistercoris]
MVDKGIALYCGATFHKELSYGDATYLNRSLIAPADVFLSEANAPQVYSQGRRWHIRNNSSYKKLVIAELTDEKGTLGLINRIPPNLSQRLPSLETYIYLGSYRVRADIIDAHYFDDPDIGPSYEPTHTSSGMARDADALIRELLTEEPWRTVTLARLQEFMDPHNARPQPLASQRVLDCIAPHLGLDAIEETQRRVKDITGMDTTAELGDWMTHRGILLGRYLDEVSHGPNCAHRRI